MWPDVGGVGDQEREWERRGGEGRWLVYHCFWHLYICCSHALSWVGGQTVASQLWELWVWASCTTPGLSVWACHFMNILSHVCYHLNPKSICSIRHCFYLSHPHFPNQIVELLRCCQYIMLNYDMCVMDVGHSLEMYWAHAVCLAPYGWVGTEEGRELQVRATCLPSQARPDVARRATPRTQPVCLISHPQYPPLSSSLPFYLLECLVPHQVQGDEVLPPLRRLFWCSSRESPSPGSWNLHAKPTAWTLSVCSLLIWAWHLPFQLENEQLKGRHILQVGLLRNIVLCVNTCLKMMRLRQQLLLCVQEWIWQYLDFSF